MANPEANFSVFENGVGKVHTTWGSVEAAQRRSAVLEEALAEFDATRREPKAGGLVANPNFPPRNGYEEPQRVMSEEVKTAGETVIWPSGSPYVLGEVSRPELGAYRIGDTGPEFVFGGPPRFEGPNLGPDISLVFNNTEEV